MCIRSVYYCQDCGVTFAIPAKRFQDTAWWKRIFQTQGFNDRQPLKDWLCDNKLCLRRTEEGYLACLNMQNHCYFCSIDCYNQYIYVPCRACYERNWLKAYNFASYCFPMHYREI